MPAPTPDADSDVALPLSRGSISLSPGPDPDSMTYDVGVQPPDGAVHHSVTVPPDTLPDNPVGADGAAVHGGGPTVPLISFDAALSPYALRALTRM